MDRPFFVAFFFCLSLSNNASPVPYSHNHSVNPAELDTRRTLEAAGTAFSAVIGAGGLAAMIGGLAAGPGPHPVLVMPPKGSRRRSLKPGNRGPASTPGSVFDTPGWGYLVKTYYTDAACTESKAFALDITALGPCIQNYAGTTPLGSYFSQSFAGTTLTTSNFSDSACATKPTIASSIFVSPACVRGVTSDFAESQSYKVTFSANMPAVNGVISASFQTLNSCGEFSLNPGAAPSRATSFAVRLLGVIHGPGTSSSGRRNNQGVWSWKESTWRSYTSCSASGFGFTDYFTADGAQTATATFIGGTGGVSSTTLTMTGIRCIDLGVNLTAYCDGTNIGWTQTGGLIAPANVGVSGSIYNGMVISVAGASASISSCMTDLITHIATCTLSSPLTIPEGTTLIGTATTARTINPTYEAQCEDSLSNYDRNNDVSTSDAQRFSAAFCGSTAVGGTFYGSKVANSAPNSPPGPTTVVYNGFTYATLSAVPVDGPCCQTQGGTLVVPPGWRIAANIPDAIAVAAAHSWSACGLLLGVNAAGGAGGKSEALQYYPSLAASTTAACASASSSSTCGSTGSSSSPLETHYGRCDFAAQVLIRQCPPGTYANGGGTGTMNTDCTACPVGKTSAAGASACVADADTLCDFYSTIPAGTGKNKLTNWCVGASGPCDAGASVWAGVSCGADSRVKGLNLNFYGLGGGSLPASIWGLAGLTNLQLGYNSLGNSIPSQLGQLTALQSLVLNGNLLVGAVPSSLCGLPTSVNLQIQSNPGLTCIPSCLTNPPYTNLNKDATLSPSCPSPPTSVPLPSPTTVPSAPTLHFASTEGPTTLPTAVPSAVRAWVVSASYSTSAGCANSDSTQLISYSATRVGACVGSSGSSIITVNADYTQYTRTSFKDHACSSPFTAADGFMFQMAVQTTSISGACSMSMSGFTSTTYTTTLPAVASVAPAGSYMTFRYSNPNACLTGNSDWSLARLTKTSTPYCQTNFWAPGASANVNALLSCTPSGIGMQIEAHETSGGNCGGALTTFKGATRWTEAVCSFADNMYYLDYLSGCPVVSSSRVLSSDAAALCDLFNTFPTTAQSALTNWCSGSVANYNPCSSTAPWLGVACATVSGVSRVTTLNLAGTSLSGGYLSGSLGILDALATLRIQDRDGLFAGTIPATLAALSSLTNLDLGGNTKIGGSIPSQLGTLSTLRVLRLDRNQLTGPVPASLCSLSPSIDLQLQNNIGLTCLPACLTNPPFTGITKNASMSFCPSTDTATSPTATPTPLSTAISAPMPSAASSLPSAVPNPLMPSPEPTPLPSAAVTAGTGVPTSVSGLTTTFSFAKAAQTYVACGATLRIDACGAKGGGLGGLGGFVSATIGVTPGQTLYVYVGEKGLMSEGFNGGGAGTGGQGSGGYGGGATDIRSEFGGNNGTSHLGSRLVVAGGGGAGNSYTGGAGGGSVGGAGGHGGSASAAASGGTQAEGGAASTYSFSDGNCGVPGGAGSLGQGGSCPKVGGGPWYFGNGGGGGYWGGGAGYDSGAGGSSYVTPGGTSLANNQGDARCSGNGFLSVTETLLATAPPTP